LVRPFAGQIGVGEQIGLTTLNITNQNIGNVRFDLILKTKYRNL
jgi:hypothetical protein